MFAIVPVVLALCVIIPDTLQIDETIFEDYQGSRSGIYYEPIYKMRVYSNEFNLLTHVNTSVFVEKFDEINNLINYNDRLCSVNKHNVSNIHSNFNSTLKITKTVLLKRYRYTVAQLGSLGPDDKVNCGPHNYLNTIKPH